MMEYRELPARAPLDRFVRCFWCLVHEPGPDPAAETILPDGHPELIFVLGRPYRAPDWDSDNETNPKSFAVGQISSAIDVVPTGRVELLGVRFRPAGLAPLFGSAMSELTDGQLELEHWAPRPFLELEERLRSTASWAQRFRLLESTLLAAPALREPPRSPLEGALDRAFRAHGQLTIDQLVQTAGVSARTLDRRFQREVGLTPKRFLRQLRFRHVFELIEHGPPVTWSDVALATGCYDQSHLVREFQAFAGMPPETYMRAQHELSDRLTGVG